MTGEKSSRILGREAGRKRILNEDAGVRVC